MPIYEYLCEKCGQVVERICRNPQQEEDCPDCGAPARRAVSAVSAPPAGQSSGCAGPSGFT